MKLTRFVLLLILASVVPSGRCFSADEEVGYISGKTYDFDKRTALQGAQVRIVNVDTGLAVEDKSNRHGCYDFEKIPFGTYSITVTYEDKDYLLADKIRVERIEEKKVVVEVCMARTEENVLILLDDCKSCKEFPIFWVVIGGAGAGVTAGIKLGGGEEPIGSPFQP